MPQVAAAMNVKPSDLWAVLITAPFPITFFQTQYHIPAKYWEGENKIFQD